MKVLEAIKLIFCVRCHPFVCGPSIRAVGRSISQHPAPFCILP